MDKNSLKIDVVITRHKGLIDFLFSKNLISEETIILEHVSPDMAGFIENKIVAGVLPLHLAAKCGMFISIEMNVPYEMRGQELSCSQVEQFLVGITAYQVRSIAL